MDWLCAPTVVENATVGHQRGQRARYENRRSNEREIFDYRVNRKLDVYAGVFGCRLISDFFAWYTEKWKNRSLAA